MILKQHSYSHLWLVLAILVLLGSVPDVKAVCDDDPITHISDKKKSKKYNQMTTNMVPQWKQILFNNWSVAANVGLCSYFGDVSIHDFDPIQKFKVESKISNGFTVSNKILPWLSVQGRILNGRFKAEKEGINRRVDGKTFQYFGSIAFDIVALFNYPDPVPEDVDIYFYGIVGYGVAHISSKLYNLEADKEIQFGQETIKEATFVFGLGLNKTIGYNFDLTFESYFNRVGTDKLDRRVSAKINDYYLYTAFGLKYNINPLVKKKRASYSAPRRR